MADRQPPHPVSGSRGGLADRLADGWRTLDANQRLAGVSAVGLLVSMTLPWFRQTGLETPRAVPGSGVAPISREVSISLTGFEAFGWTQAALLLVGCGVVALIAARADRRPFHLPGGDGAVIAAAGIWCLFLLVWGAVIDPPERVGLQSGVDWGLLVAAIASALVVLAGVRIRAAHRPEPPLPAAVVAVEPQRPESTSSEATVPLSPQPPAPDRPTPASSGTQLQFGDVEPIGGTGRAASDPREDDATAEQLEIPIDVPPRRRRRRRDG